MRSADTISQLCREELHKSCRMAILYEHKPLSRILNFSPPALSCNRLIKICVTFFPWKYGSFTLSWQSRPQIVSIVLRWPELSGRVFLLVGTYCLRLRVVSQNVIVQRVPYMCESHVGSLRVVQGLLCTRVSSSLFGQLHSVRPLIGPDFEL